MSTTVADTLAPLIDATLGTGIDRYVFPDGESGMPCSRSELLPSS
ncbi:MAG TPA: hypothetical protein VH496_09365 [Mycobacterium sp.]|jgi:hypothetical protein